MDDIVRRLASSTAADVTTGDVRGDPIDKSSVTLAQAGERERLTINKVDQPCYMANNQFEVEWSNELARSELFGSQQEISKDIRDRNVF